MMVASVITLIVICIGLIISNIILTAFFVNQFEMYIDWKEGAEVDDEQTPAS